MPSFLILFPNTFPNNPLLLLKHELLVVAQVTDSYEGISFYNRVEYLLFITFWKQFILQYNMEHPIFRAQPFPSVLYLLTP